MPVLLYAASGDHEMPIASAIHSQEALRAHDAEVTLVDVGDVDHVGSAQLSVPQILERFDDLESKG